jgi:hypothetical protein
VHAARRAILDQARAGGDGIATMLARVAAFIQGFYSTPDLSQ